MRLSEPRKACFDMSAEYFQKTLLLRLQTAGVVA
jgi:hypothetical protein